MLTAQQVVTSEGGVMRTPTLAAKGFARAALTHAVDSGELVRVRRGWVATPGADPELVNAARGGYVLSCISGARRKRLWVLAEERMHVAAPPHAGRVSAGSAHVHRAVAVVPRHPDRLVDEIENVLALVATCQPYEVALAIYESALNKRLVDKAAFERLALPPAARRLCAEATPFADSGLESFAVPRLRWMKLPLRRQVWIAGRPVDLLIGDRLVLQIDGGHHVGAQREADIAHDAELMLRGFHVIRVGYAAMLDDWPAVQDRIMRAVAQGLHLAPRS